MPKHTLAASLEFASLVSSGPAPSQACRTKPVRLVVPTRAGSVADSLTRLLGGAHSRELPQPFVIQSKVDAKGIISVQTVAQATPDDTTLIVGNLWAHTMNPALCSSMIKKAGINPG